jgi:hypothetical protein
MVSSKPFAEAGPDDRLPLLIPLIRLIGFADVEALV